MSESLSYEQLQKKVVELSELLKQRTQSDLIYQTLYEISSKVGTSIDLSELFQAIHQALSKIIDTTNFFIATYDQETDCLRFPYVVDVTGVEYPVTVEVSKTSSLSIQVIKTGKPLLLTRAESEEFRRNSKLKQLNDILAEIWLGVPLQCNDTTVGVMAVQSYDNPELYSYHDVNILTAVADQVALAIERQRMKDVLALQEERFRLAMGATKEGLWDWNKGGGEHYYNPNFWLMLGYDSEFDMRGLGEWTQLIHPEDRERVLQINRECITGQRDDVDVEFRMRTKSGSWKWVHARGSVIQRDDNGKAYRMVGTHEDIDARVQNEKERSRLEKQLRQAQKMESVGRLAGGVAHDFNNMLSVIIGHVEMAIDGLSADDPLRYDLEQIEKAAHHSADLTRQLLAFARKQSIVPKLLDINDVIDKHLSMLKRLLGEDIELFWIPGDNIGTVHIDPGQLDQILTNICVNARDAIRTRGKIIIETSFIALDDEYCSTHAGFVPGEYVVLSISDNGVGIDPAVLPYVFEPFYTTKDVGRGTGLGLATVYGILKQNNCFINVYSEMETGTVFTLYFPRFLDSEERLETESVDEPKVTGDETILLVEDEQAILDMAAQMLQNEGYTVLTAENPNQAIELLKGNKNDVHLLLTDVIMPEMNGKELMQEICTFYPDISTIFMSGYTANVISEQGGGVEEDFNFIQKPFVRKVFLAKVREVLDKKKL